MEKSKVDSIKAGLQDWADKEAQVEYLLPEDVPEDVSVELAPLQFTAPLEQFQNLFDRMADIRAKVILWESKTVIKDTKSRDEAILLRTTVTRTAKAIEEAYLSLTEPAREYLKQVRAMATKAQEALVGTKDNPRLGVAGRLTVKVSEYAAECKRIEEEMKAKALAEQRRIEAELEAKKREEEAKEQALRLEEERQIKELEEKKLKEAQEAGRNETDQMEADIAMEEAQAQIDADRAYRERKAKEAQIEADRIRDEAQQKMVSQMAVAESKGKVKGVKEIWTIELIDEDLLDKKYMVFDPSKARKALEAGFYDKKEKDTEKIIPGLRCVVVLGKGGK